MTAFVLLMTFISMASVVYAFGVQDPLLKLEKVLCSLTIMLTTTEVIFGVMFFFPCFKRIDYN